MKLVVFVLLGRYVLIGTYFTFFECFLGSNRLGQEPGKNEFWTGNRYGKDIVFSAIAV